MRIRNTCLFFKFFNPLVKVIDMLDYLMKASFDCFGDLILNREVKIGESSEVHHDELLVLLKAMGRHSAIVTDVIGNSKFIYDSHIFLIPDLFNASTNNCLVVF